jgi:hypothetical protein
VITKNLILFILAGSIWACVSGPKTDGRTFADKMNGENYQSTNVVFGVPVLERKPLIQKFAGRVFCGEGISMTPANHALVSLSHENITDSSVSADTGGNYTMAVTMDPEISYQLQATASCGHSSKSLSKAKLEQAAEVNFHLAK